MPQVPSSGPKKKQSVTAGQQADLAVCIYCPDDAYRQGKITLSQHWRPQRVYWGPEAASRAKRIRLRLLICIAVKLLITDGH